VLASTAAGFLKEIDLHVNLYDLRNYDLDFCGIPIARDNEGLSELKSAIEQSAAVLLAVPIYNFDVNAAGKNLLELTGRSWTNAGWFYVFGRRKCKLYVSDGDCEQPHA
jgi:NAD(P)H-dependent FMN reductase